MSHPAAPRSEATNLNHASNRSQLRGLLREASYLPDARAKKWVTRHIVNRYKSYSGQEWDSGPNVDEKRLMEKKKEARNALGRLQRANQGERKVLLKILLMAYGRTGRKKRQLMQTLTQKDDNAVEAEIMEHLAGQAQRKDGQTPSALEVIGSGIAFDAQVSEENMSKKQRDTLTAARLSILPAQLRAVVQSQIQASPPSLTTRNPKTAKPSLPGVNSWLDPMPKSRLKNMVKEWYANLLNRVLPPLPDEEWHELKAKAEGNFALSRLRFHKRMSLAGGPRTLSQPTMNSLELVVMYGTVPERALGNKRARTIDRRFMRRLYAQVFEQCPLMEWDVEGKKWRITWGEKALVQGHDFKSSSHSDATSSAIGLIEADMLDELPEGADRIQAT